MSTLPKLQSKFSTAILTDELKNIGLLKEIVAGDLDPEARLQIYRNNTYLSLTDSLAETYPACRNWVGHDFFKYAAYSYIKSHPPISACLSEFGRHFAKFLKSFLPTEKISWLFDLAHLEWLISRSYFAENIQPLNLQDFQKRGISDLSPLIFTVHPAHFIFSSSYDLKALWDKGIEGETEQEFDIHKPIFLWIHRVEGLVSFEEISKSTYDFLQNLLEGKTLGDSYKETGDLDVSHLLSVLLSKGFFENFTP